MPKHCLSLKNEKNSFILLRKLNRYVLSSLSLELTIQNLHINKDVVIAFLRISKSYVKKCNFVSLRCLHVYGYGFTIRNKCNIM